jgi:hypothetical protein
MIEGSQCIANKLSTTFPLGIMLTAPLFGEICMAETKMQSKHSPRQERVKLLIGKISKNDKFG